MEWEYEFVFKLGRLALLRKKDKYMIGKNAKRWAIGHCFNEYMAWSAINIL